MTKKILSSALRISRGAKEKLKLGNIEVKRDWGYALDYVKVMWLMLQQEKPEDFIIATGEAHSIAEFTAEVFKCLGLDWSEHVITDSSLYRPSDIDVIYGDPSKARAKLGWDYCLSFEDLIRLLVDEEQKWAQGVLS